MARFRVGATFLKFCGEMAYFWQIPLWDGLRSGAWLTAARMRGYSPILPGLGVIARVGGMAVSDIDRS